VVPVCGVVAGGVQRGCRLAGVGDCCREVFPCSPDVRAALGCLLVADAVIAVVAVEPGTGGGGLGLVAHRVPSSLVV
jgi:hypothetical protein